MGDSDGRGGAGDQVPPAILLMGPTASGKTELALQLVERLPCEIISVDSAMIYRGMDIGTAKPGAELLAVAPHRLIDICDPPDAYSAARFREDALREMADISAQGRIPLLVGGTMLYYRVLQQGLSSLPEADPRVRSRLEREAETIGWEGLHERLATLDPESARRIHPNDPQRIQRALEVFELSGRPMSLLFRETRDCTTLPYRLIKLIRAPEDRGELHKRIERRFHQMLADGFEAEVRSLWDRGDLTPETPSMRCVGYRQLLKYVLGEYSYRNMVQRGIVATRQLAKRQFTWLRSEPDVTWLYDRSGLLDAALEIVGSVTPLVENSTA